MSEQASVRRGMRFWRDNHAAPPHCPGMRRHHRVLVLLLLVGAAIILAVSVGRRLRWDTLADNREALAQWVATHPAASVLLFVLAYVLTAALSLPNATVLTVAGGLLFGTVLGCALSVIGATTGASLLLLVARLAFGAALARRDHGLVATVRGRLQRDGFNYLLAMRLVPFVPFWVVNLAAAAGGMRLRAFVLATVLGIIPDSLLLSSIGSGVDGILAAGRTPDLSMLFAPRVVLPLLGLAALSLLPLLLRRSGAHA